MDDCVAEGRGQGVCRGGRVAISVVVECGQAITRCESPLRRRISPMAEMRLPLRSRVTSFTRSSTPSSELMLSTVARVWGSEFLGVSVLYTIQGALMLSMNAWVLGCGV